MTDLVACNTHLYALPTVSPCYWGRGGIGAPLILRESERVREGERERLAIALFCQVRILMSFFSPQSFTAVSAHYSGLHAANQMLVNQIQQLAQILHQMASGVSSSTLQRSRARHPELLPPSYHAWTAHGPEN